MKPPSGPKKQTQNKANFFKGQNELKIACRKIRPKFLVVGAYAMGAYSQIISVYNLINFPFTLKLANGLSLVNYTGSAQCCLAGFGRFRPAGQLADCHIHLPVRLVAVGQKCLFHLYIDCDSNLSSSWRTRRVHCGDDRGQEIRSKLARLGRGTFRRCNRCRPRHVSVTYTIFGDPAWSLLRGRVVRMGNGVLPRNKG